MRKLPPFERFLRRSSVYRGRIGGMVTGRKLKSPCAFMHLPKCGGTSLSEALYALVPLNQKIGILDAPSTRRALSIFHEGLDDVRPFHDEGDNSAIMMQFREQLLLMHMAHESALVHGHFLFSEKAYQAFGQSYKYITIMRDPLARTISNYRMAARNKVFVGDFDAFLQSSMGRRMALHSLRYFSGQADIAGKEEANLLAIAKTNMDRFALVGFIEQQDKFASAFHDIFGAAPQIGHHNAGGEDQFEITSHQRARLERLCAPDIELWDYARRRA